MKKVVIVASIMLTVALGLVLLAGTALAGQVADAPAVPTQPEQGQRLFEFIKDIDKDSAKDGDLFTVTLKISPTVATPSLTYTLRITIYDNNEYPAVFEFITSTISGGAYYDGSNRAVVWPTEVNSATKAATVTFQVKVHVPVSLMTSTVFTNYAYLVWGEYYGAPGSLPGEEGRWGNAPARKVWDTVTIVPPPYRIYLPVVSKNYKP